MRLSAVVLPVFVPFAICRMISSATCGEQEMPVVRKKISPACDIGGCVGNLCSATQCSDVSLPLSHACCAS